MVPLALARFAPPPGYTRERFAARPVTPRLMPLKDTVVGSAGGMLWVVMGALALLLLIACANVANLLLSVRKRGSGNWRFGPSSARAGRGSPANCWSKAFCSP